MDDIEYRDAENNFQDTIDEAKEEAKGIWNNIKQVTTHSHVMFYFYNATAQTFRLSSASWNPAGAEEKYVIQPWDYLSFVLRENTPVFANGKLSTKAIHQFSYRGDNQAFEFSTTLKISKEFDPLSFTPKTIPHREHTIRSTGAVRLQCDYHVTRAMADRPFHYGVIITLGDNF